MRATRASVVIVAAYAVLAAVVPHAAAQNVYVELEAGRAAFAYWEDAAREQYAYVLAGQGVLYNSDLGEPVVGEIGCAAVITPKRAAFGCGSLSTFAISDDLGSAEGAGTFDSLIFDRSGKVSRRGKISFATSWKATSDPLPDAEGGYYLLQGEIVRTYVASAVLRRDATGAVKGGVKQSPVGRGPAGRPTGGAILLGSDVTIALQ